MQPNFKTPPRFDRKKARHPASIVWVLIAVCGLGATAHAETVYFKRGGTLEGDVVERKETVDVGVEKGRATFSQSDIHKVDWTPTQSTVFKKAAAEIHGWKSALFRVTNSVRNQAVRIWRKIRETVAGWMQPVSRSHGVMVKEKAANDAMLEMQKVLKDVHARDRKVSQVRREMKREGVEW